MSTSTTASETAAVEPQPIILIGGGRIGTALHEASHRAGHPSHLVRRETGWEAISPSASGPILVATRNDDLEAVLERLPPERREDLALIQNGMLRPWLTDRGLEGITRGLLFFAVPSRGAAIQPGAPSPFCGPHAKTLVSWLHAIGLAAEEVDEEAFLAVELEKLIWNSAFGLLCQSCEADVGSVVRNHRKELEGLVQEMVQVGGAALGLSLELEPLMESLCAYSLSLGDYRGSVKEWRWRNGFFVEAAERHHVATPIHEDLLRSVGRP